MVLLSSFHLNGHTLGFHPQTEKVQLHYIVQTIKFHHLSEIMKQFRCGYDKTLANKTEIAFVQVTNLTKTKSEIIRLS